GKNIVGVVLGCNNYEIIDLGVMVSADKILDTAVEKSVDLIGLSGLITPSLDEMVHVAREMRRRGMSLPLLIGGATTSAKHTAVKIAPMYDRGVIHVLDASRSVGVVEKLINPDSRDGYLAGVRAEQGEIAANYAERKVELAPYAEALSKRFTCDWSSVDLPKPEFLGVRTIEDQSLEELLPYVDWSPFFMAWELHGKYPKILDDEVVGEAARELFDNARTMMRRLIDERLITAKGTFGFWPAASDGDDIVLWSDEGRTREVARLCMLRQQWKRQGQTVFRSLADYVAPIDSGRQDHIGAFVVTTGHGVEELASRYRADKNDYDAIMVQALADRLAEAFAEKLHRDARRAWSYGRDERLSNEELIDEKYRGIRPAPGYPACPDHTEKRKLFDLLSAEGSTGVNLTESYAMWPSAAVAGWYFAHPEARYFAVDRITEDQVESYAQRKGMTVEQIERWLAPNLGYVPK
ncbi:MAG TPA: methionine synthase, partial [Planctomycetaceae bacterium]|nr:methionine synthase [Planctomycetaceae bacterium]